MGSKIPYITLDNKVFFIAHMVFMATIFITSRRWESAFVWGLPG